MTWLADLDDAIRSEANGGKWRSLSRMHRLGFSVPPAFCVDASAYTEFVTRLRAANTVRGEVSVRDDDSFTRVPLPAGLESEVQDALRAFEPGSRVAVRSSATGEDGYESSFAGQYDTFLNLESLEEVLLAIRKCWASAWSPRVREYRIKRGESEAGVIMSVILQEMVQADVSGVAFTVHPLDCDADSLVIEACEGLGEQLVSGAVTPQHIQLARAGSAVSLADSGCQSLLSDRQLVYMRDEFVRMERLMGFPCDIEWAIRGERLYFLQARPITSISRAARAEDRVHSDSDGVSLKGIPVSAGIIQEAAYVVTESTSLSAFPGGMILVAESTDPSWTHYLSQASGLILEKGGMLSHGAIVAREFKIPAVAGVSAATRKIQTGNIVHLNGAVGTIRVVDDKSSQYAETDAVNRSGQSASIEIDANELSVLMALRLAGRTDIAGIELRSVEGEDVIRGIATKLIDAGLVREKGGLYSLTSEGDLSGARAFQAGLQESSVSAIRVKYSDFVEQNPRFKRIVSDVQLGSCPYPEALSRLTSVHGQLSLLLGELVSVSPRFNMYLRRFARALALFAAADARYLASPIVDSYHSIWFELHQEFLHILDETRAFGD